MSIPNQKKILLPIFFLSGFSALVYEVIWARMLSLAFGSTFEAVSAVVTAFMFGLAAGSYFMGRWADGRKDILFTYSLTELAIGLTSLSFYFIILALPNIYYTLNLNIENAPFLFYYEGRPVRYGLQFLLVAAPAFLIGATFPLMVKSYISSRNYIGEGMSIIYAVNTFGGVFGAFLTGFFLIPSIGTRLTIFTAVSINVFLSLASYLIGRFYSAPVSASPVMPHGIDLGLPDAAYSTARISFSILTVLTISGFAALAYQIAWTRVLVMVIGNSVYAFTTILTTFLVGIAVGSFAFIRRIDEVKDKVLLLGILQILLCFSVIGMLPMMDSLPGLFLSLFRHLPTNFTGTVIIEFIVTFTVILVPTILMGASFPVAARIYVSMVDHIGEGLGRLYSANTIGAIFGSFLTGFIFIPTFGVQKTILYISTLNFFSFVILIGQVRLRKEWRIAITALSALLFFYYAATIHTWNKNVLNRGVYLYAEVLKKLPDMGATLAEFSDEFKLLFYEEGRQGTVAVSSTKGTLSLQINGKTDASTSEGDMITQIMSAVLPHLIHPRPRDTIIIGLGSGISLGAAERFPLQKLDSIEILPEVVKANRYFSSFNHKALNDPRVNMIIADGRRFLSTTGNKYDIIISEPSNPWITGVSNLFTLDFFKAAKNRLKEGGIICQWYQLYCLDIHELKALLNTFSSVFPHVSVWAFTPEDLIVLGSNEPIRLDDDRLLEAFSTPEIKEELSRAGIRDPLEIKSAYLMGSNEVKKFSKGAGLNTDDRPIVEFEAPKALYRPTVEKNMEAIILAVKNQLQ